MKKFQKNIGKKNFKIFGIIPARMAASRFPGKPLKKICNMPMLEHVYLRAKMFSFWDNLSYFSSYSLLFIIEENSFIILADCR